MPSAAAVPGRKKSLTKYTSNRVVEKDRDGNDEDVLENLTAELPPKETWEAELYLDTLVLG
jgi:hypothetical protein